jgi:hypothetical protein
VELTSRERDVDPRKHGQYIAFNYHLNRDHLAAEHIVGLADLQNKLLKRIEDRLESWRPRPRHAAVFGSAARGFMTADSDIATTRDPWSSLSPSLRSVAATSRSWTRCWPRGSLWPEPARGSTNNCERNDARVRTQPCNSEIVQGRLRKAGSFLDAANVIHEFADQDEESADVYVTLCVHAGIAASDVICRAAAALVEEARRTHATVSK